MLNREIISPVVTSLSKDNTVADGLRQMEALGISQLPVVTEGVFQGIISEEDLMDTSENELVGSLVHDYLPFSVAYDDHFLSAARLYVSRHLKVVPVVGAQQEYVGAITAEELLGQLTKLTGLMDSGALIVVELEPQQFSITEISRLVETNDAQITQLNTYSNEVTGHLSITLRINKTEVSDIVATFQRYDYTVVYYAGEEHYENELRRNFNHLMNFLEM